MIDAADRALLEETVRAGLEREPNADALLVELDWPEMLRAEPQDAVDIVFTALGATNAAATALDDVVVAALGLEPSADRAALLPPFASWSPPARFDGNVVRARGLASARAATAAELVVVTGSDVGSATRGTAQLVIVPATAANVIPVRGIDPDLGLQRVDIEVAATETRDLDFAAWTAAVAAGRLAVAHQISGGCRVMLELACAHAVERVQFGRPIARFQAVRHRLADALVAVESLASALAVAGEVPDATTSALAKAIAGRTAQTVAAHCQQVLAGIGFTTDHAFHRYLKRTLALEGLFGSSDEIVTGIGRDLIDARCVPTLIEL